MIRILLLIHIVACFWMTMAESVLHKCCEIFLDLVIEDRIEDLLY